MQIQGNKLSNLQLELLKIFSFQLTTEQLLEVRKILGQYFANQAINEANSRWDEKDWGEEKATFFLENDVRTQCQKS